MLHSRCVFFDSARSPFHFSNKDAFWEKKKKKYAPWSKWDKTRGTFFPYKFCAYMFLLPVSDTALDTQTVLRREGFHRTGFGKPSVTFYSKVPEFRCSLDVNEWPLKNRSKRTPFLTSGTKFSCLLQKVDDGGI